MLIGRFWSTLDQMRLSLSWNELLECRRLSKLTLKSQLSSHLLIQPVQNRFGETFLSFSMLLIKFCLLGNLISLGRKLIGQFINLVFQSPSNLIDFDLMRVYFNLGMVLSIV